MEHDNFLQYEYTMPDTPESNRLVINMDEAEPSDGACSVSDEFIHGKSTTTSACDPLPSFDMFSQTQSMSQASCWYKMPSTDENSSSNIVETTHLASSTQFTETSGVGEKQDSADRSFLMDSILGLEQHCYDPRHSTPAKDVHNTYTHQTKETGSSLHPNVTEKYPYTQTLNLNSLLKPAKDENISKKPSTVTHVYKRQADKPPYSYVSMVIVAIMQSEKKQLSLAGIREKLMEMFPFFRGEYTGWKNSIRHALSNSKCFYKVEKYDDGNTTTIFEWKVNTKFVKPYTFNRHSKGPHYENFKFTLQEELGLPPFQYSTEAESLCKGDIKLPSKPCFQSDPLSLGGSVSEDFLNARNDSAPTPQSTVSDLDSVNSVCSSAMGVKSSRKRKRMSDFDNDAQQTAHAAKRQTTPFVAMENQYPNYGYPQSTDSVRSYNPYLSYYQNYGQHWSHDFYQYGNTQQTFASANPLNSDDLALRYWWFNQAFYHEMGPGSIYPAYNSNMTEWCPSTALNLTKNDDNGQDK